MANATLDTNAILAELETKAAKQLQAGDQLGWMKTRQEIRNVQSGKSPATIPMEQRPIDESDPFLNVKRSGPDSLDAAQLGGMEGATYGIGDYSDYEPTPPEPPAPAEDSFWNRDVGDSLIDLWGRTLGNEGWRTDFLNTPIGESPMQGPMPPDEFVPGSDFMTSGDGITLDDMSNPDMLPPGASTEPTVTDRDGNEVPTPEQDEVGQAIREITQADSGRGGSSWDDTAEWGVGSVTPVDVDGRFGGGLRKKIGSFFGHDSEEELQRFGSALQGFGTGLLTGGPDIGEAFGHGFAKAADQFHGMKKDQRQAALDDLKVAREDERLSMERQEFNDKRREVALQRLERIDSGKYIQDKDGNLIPNPEYQRPRDPKGNWNDALAIATTLVPAGASEGDVLEKAQELYFGKFAPASGDDLAALLQATQGG